MKKRTICLLLAMIMVLSIVLAGCSKTAETPAADETPATTEPAETTDNTETPEAPEETAEPALEQKTIQLMITGAGKQANSDKVWAAFNEQLQQYVPNTTVEFIDVPFEEYSEKFSQVLASGEGVDLAWTGWLINKPQNIADGNLMPLDDLLAEYGQGIVDILGENVVEIHRNADDGKLYYLPSWQGLVGDRRGWLVVTEIAELAGDTWIEDTEAALNKWRNNYSGIEDFQAVLDQATKYLAAAKEAGKLGAGINTGRAFGWSMYNGMYSFLGVGGAEIGITYCDGTFTVKDGVAGEHYKLYAKTMADWYKEGYIRSDIMSVDTSTLTMPKNGEITDTTYVFSCDPYLTEADQEAAIADAGMDMTYLPIEENAYLILGGDTSYAIPYCADEPERAMMVLNAIYSQPDLYNTLIYGIEGEDYTKNADGTITTSYVGASPTADDSYGIQRWIIGSCKNALINNGTDPNYYADLEALEATAQVNPFLNFTFDRTNVEGICASILNVYYEYGPQIDNGVAGDNWEELYNNYMAAPVRTQASKSLSPSSRTSSTPTLRPTISLPGKHLTKSGRGIPSLPLFL